VGVDMDVNIGVGMAVCVHVCVWLWQYACTCARACVRILCQLSITYLMRELDQWVEIFQSIL